MTRAEWRWLIVATAVVLLLTSAPYLIGLAVSTPSRPFTGVVIAADDVYSYLAKMRLGASGAWLFSNVYAVEPHPTTLIYQPYLLLGRLAGVGIGARVSLMRLLVVYHAARVLFGAALLVVLYPVASLLLVEPKQRRLAWILTVLGGGLGWLMVILSDESLPFGTAPLDFYVNEAVTYVPLIATPHVLMARTALLGGVLAFVRAVEHRSWLWALAAGGCWLLATTGVPFDILVAGGIVGGWLTVRWMRTRRLPLRMVLMGVITGLPGVAFVCVALIFMGDDPVYASWMAQNSLPLPHPFHLLSAYGVLALLSVLGGVAALRVCLPRADLFVGWAILSPLLMLVPLSFQLRLVEGFTIPLATLAACGFCRLVGGWRKWIRRVAMAGLLVLTLPSGLFVIFGSIALPLFGFDSAFYSPDQSAALEWLRQNAPPGAVVLSGEATGIILPAAAPVRVVLGHGFETPYFIYKEALVADFYALGMPDRARQDFLAHYGVRYVYLGPDERVLASASAGCVGQPPDPDMSGLRKVFSQGAVMLYEAGSP